MFCETITFFLTPAVQLDTDHTMVNSSPVTSLSYLESRLILVTKNRSTAPTAKQRQLVINCKSYDEEYESNSARGFRLPSNPFSSLSSTSCSNIHSSSGGQANLTLGDSNIELVARLPCCQSPHLGFSSLINDNQ